jgi:uncharacterized membrane protein YgcG
MSIELILLLLVLYLNIVATYHVRTSTGFELRQKTYQYFLAWLLPIIGSAIVIAFALSDKEHITNLKAQKGLPSQLVRILTLATFAGSGGSIQGIGDGGYSDGFDGGGCDGGGDGGD